MSDNSFPGQRMPHPSTVDGSPLFIFDLTPSVRQVAGVLGAVTIAAMVGMTWAAVLALTVLDIVSGT